MKSKVRLSAAAALAAVPLILAPSFWTEQREAPGPARNAEARPT